MNYTDTQVPSIVIITNNVSLINCKNKSIFILKLTQRSQIELLGIRDNKFKSLQTYFT